jgi:hypothetical protein
MLKYWNWLVEMDAGRLVKQAFLASAVLARELARTNSNTSHRPVKWSPSFFTQSTTLPRCTIDGNIKAAEV